MIKTPRSHESHVEESMTMDELITSAVKSFETYLKAVVSGDAALFNQARRNYELAEREICTRAEDANIAQH